MIGSLPTNSLISETGLPTKAGSPGPFESIKPLTPEESTSLAVVVDGKTVTFEDLFESSLKMFFLYPKSSIPK